MDKSVEDIVKDCISGKDDASKEHRGVTYCSRLSAIYYRPCRYMSKKQIEVVNKFGNFDSTRYYSKCMREE